MLERGVSEADVEAALRNPTATYPGQPRGKLVIHASIRGRVLRLPTSLTSWPPTEPFTIITVMWEEQS